MHMTRASPKRPLYISTRTDDALLRAVQEPGPNHACPLLRGDLFARAFTKCVMHVYPVFFRVDLSFAESSEYPTSGLRPQYTAAFPNIPELYLLPEYSLAGLTSPPRGCPTQPPPFPTLPFPSGPASVLASEALSSTSSSPHPPLTSLTHKSSHPMRLRPS